MGAHESYCCETPDISTQVLIQNCRSLFLRRGGVPPYKQGMDLDMDHDFDLDDRPQAFFTPAPVLTPAACQDFGNAISTLTRLGRFDEAVLLRADCGDPALPTSHQWPYRAWRPAGMQSCTMCRHGLRAVQGL